MSVSQQLLHSQLSLALWTCQQLPPCSRIRHRISQLLEVAIDLSTCADTPLGCPDPSLWPSTAWPCPATQQQHAACAPPHWQQHAQPSSQHVPPAAPTGFYPAAPPSQHTHCATPDTNTWQYAAAGREKVRGKRRCRRILLRHTRGGRGAGSSDNASSTSPPAQPRTSPAPGKPSRFGVQEAEVHGTAGMSAQEVSTLAAAVRGLSSRYGCVQTAAALKLQEITAHWPHPEAVAEACMEVDAVQDLTALLSSSTSSSACKAAAAAALCNMGWYPASRTSMLAAGTVPMLAAMLWDEAHACRTEAACALFALTSSHNELACAAVVAAGGIPRLVGLMEAVADSNNGSSSSSSSGVDVDASIDGGDGESSSAPAGCNNAAGGGGGNSGGGGSKHHATDPPRPQPEAAAAAAPDAAATAAAVSVLGNLAAGSAARRTAIATTGDALPRIVACLKSPDKELRLAAVRALLHITHGDSWRLTDGLVVAQVKAAGALAAVRSLVDLSASGPGCVDETCEAFQLWAQLNALPPPLIGHDPEAGWELVGGAASA